MSAAVGRTVAEAIAAALAAGTDGPAFGVLGEGSLAVVYDLVHRHGRRYVAAAREDGAVLMADGFGRAGGGLGLAAITHGPALTNAVTALTEAARARTPLVVLVGDTPPDDRRNPQDIDQVAVVAPTGAGFQPVTSAAAAPADVALALRRARTERRPIVLNVPTPLLDQPAPPDDVDPSVAPPQAVAPDPDAVARAAAVVAGSRRPLVVAGRGAATEGARHAALELAERAGALVGTTLLAKGLFRGDPYDVGVCGGYTATRAARDLIAGADCVVAVGAGLTGFTTDGGALLAGAPIVQIDIDPAAFGRWTPPTVAVQADAAAGLRALAAALPPATDTWRTAATAARLAGARDEEVAAEAKRATSAAEAGRPVGLDLHAVVRVLDELVPEQRTVVVDGGHAALSEPSRSLAVPDPTGFVFPLHFGSIGLSLGSAVGAAFARPDRVTLCTVGDGGFLMSLAELDTAVRHQLELVVVVLNDGGYGWEYHQMRDQGRDPALSLIARPDFAAVARGFGADGVAVETVDELRAALEDRLPALGRPLVIDAQIDRDVRTEWYATHASAPPAGLDP
ncbi:MAG TPA: thiamine pyrophosphate-binding protein [Acidimicrobiales bacterium]